MTENKKAVNPSPELKDEELDKVSGGIQATVVYGDKGPGEFGENKPKPQEETEEQRHRRLMLEAEGSTFL